MWIGRDTVRTYEQYADAAGRALAVSAAAVDAQVDANRFRESADRLRQQVQGLTRDLDAAYARIAELERVQ
jgi:predicted ATP-grasp superfamily ATP-dependent carboligase